LQQAGLALGQIIAHWVDREPRCYNHFIGYRKHLPQQRIGRIAGPHPGQEPARHEEAELP
jgi:hypothetical protein